MKKPLHGSLTVEAAVIVPLILMVFSVLLNTLFYYHDKNIITGAAYETVVRGSSEEETDSELEAYYQSRVKGKLLLFTYTTGEIEQEEDIVRITCTAIRKKMSLCIERATAKTNPEGYIRNIRKIEKLGEKVGEDN